MTKYNINNKLGIIILRHVKNIEQNKLWYFSYECARKIYPNIKIMIVDDNSDYEYITNQNKLINTIIIRSEYSGRGELLPYYYLFKTKIFDKALIIHDTSFICNYINIDINDNIKFLWQVSHYYDELLAGYKIDNTMNKPVLKYLNHSDDLLTYYNRRNEENPPWYGVFGVMSIVKRSFINVLHTKYNLFNVFNYVKVRRNRAEMERIFGLLCCYENNISDKNFCFSTLNGDLHCYLQNNDLWKYSHKNNINNLINDINNNNISINVNIIKVIGFAR